MVISTDEELDLLKDIGRLCAVAMQTMADALEPGITTAELDAIG
ncbi:type I methionyl aminopeptidase, partial [Agrobacterium sp. DKPNP3]